MPKNVERWANRNVSAVGSGEGSGDGCGRSLSCEIRCRIASQRIGGVA